MGEWFGTPGRLIATSVARTGPMGRSGDASRFRPPPPRCQRTQYAGALRGRPPGGPREVASHNAPQQESPLSATFAEPTDALDAPSPSFAAPGVPEALAEPLAERGIREPFPIQAATIAAALDGRDVCGKAPTGSGKTLAFGIPLAERVSRARVA